MKTKSLTLFLQNDIIMLRIDRERGVGMEKQINIAYVRVSDILQNQGRQVEELEKHNIDKWYKEKVSGKDTNRPKLQEMLDYINNFYEFNKGLDPEQQRNLTEIGRAHV